MHVHFLDPFQARLSPIHQLDPRVKLILVLAFILTTALVPPGAWPVYILLFAIALSVILLSNLGINYVWRRSALALPFILAAVPIVFTAPGPTLGEITLGSWTLTISAVGLERFLSIAFKSWLSVQMAIILAASTSFPDLLVAMRAIHIPRLLVAIFSLMWRYLFILADEALRLNRARAARSGQSITSEAKPGGALSWRARDTGNLAGNLLLRAFDRSDRVYMAMLSRGYDGEIRALPLPELQRSQRFLAVLGIAVLILLLLLSYLL